MKKADIQEALSHVGNSTEANIVAADLVRNIQIFGDEVIVDVESVSPTLQSKKKLEGLSTWQDITMNVVSKLLN